MQHHWSMRLLPFRSTWVHSQFLVGLLLLDLKFYVYVLEIVACPFVLFLLVIVLSVLLWYTDSDCPFGIFILFLPCKTCKSNLQLQKIKCIRKAPQTATLPPPNAVVPIMFLLWNAVFICRQTRTRSSTEHNKNRLIVWPITKIPTEMVTWPIPSSPPMT